MLHGDGARERIDHLRAVAPDLPALTRPRKRRRHRDAQAKPAARKVPADIELHGKAGHKQRRAAMRGERPLEGGLRGLAYEPCVVRLGNG